MGHVKKLSVVDCIAECTISHHTGILARTNTEQVSARAPSDVQHAGMNFFFIINFV